MNYNVIKKIPIGSKVFFERIDGFVPKDTDEVWVTDKPFLGGKRMRFRFGDKDVFFTSEEDKELLFDLEFFNETPMAAGKFLVPEFVDFMGFTINDLKKLESIFNIIDEKHDYEKIIYDSYIENNGFYLTEEQTKNAYKRYKETRLK